VIYVEVEAVKSEDRGRAGGNGWHDTDDIGKAIAAELERFHRTWDHLGHGAIVTYKITVAPEASPRRTIGGACLPLPVSDASPSLRASNEGDER
jgi:hypothetical protein